jgi:hypothetical protein
MELAARRKLMAIETVVFVLGAKVDPGYPWMFFHFDPFKDTVPEPVRLALFDYPAGTLKIWNSVVPKRGTRPPSAPPDSETPLTPMTRLRLEDGSIDPGPERPSVLALYDWVKGQTPRTIRSLQIFTHGWAGGPILWDSWEFGTDGSRLEDSSPADRDANDTDFRIRDFKGSNPLAGAEGAKFANAFVASPFIKLWGCVAPEDGRVPLRNYMRIPKGAAGDAARKAHLTNYLEFVGMSFAMQMAGRLGLAVWASPYGWGADYGSVVPTRGDESIRVTYRGVFPPDLSRDRWWRVSWLFRNSDPGARFYRDVFKARIDAVDYVEYRKDWFQSVANGLRASADNLGVTTPVALQQQLTERVDELSDTA